MPGQEPGEENRNMASEQDKQAKEAELDAREGDLPDHLNPGAADNDVAGGPNGLTEDMVYGKGDDAAPSDEATDTPPAEKPAADTPPQEDQAQPKEAAKATEPTGKPQEGDSEPEKPAWDKERQARDQKIANLEKQNAQLTETLAAQSRRPGEGDELDAEKPTGTAATDEQLREQIHDLTDLDEYADDDERLEHDRKRTELVKELARRDLARGEKAQAAANSQAYEQILTDADAKYGKEFRNEAVAKVEELWAKKGYGPGNYPDADTTELAVMGVYAELKAAAGAKALEDAKTTAKRPAQTGPPDDSGLGGQEALRPSDGMQDVDEAWDELEAEGRVDWAKGRR